MSSQLLDCFYFASDEDLEARLRRCAEVGYSKDYNKDKLHIEKCDYKVYVNFDLLQYCIIEPLSEYPDYVRVFASRDIRFVVRKSDLPSNLQL